MKKEFLESSQKIIDYKKTLIHEMSKISSMDIDDEEDFKICESLVKTNLLD